MKRIFLSFGAAVALMNTTPAMAQAQAGDEATAEELDQMVQGLTEMFPRPPLTAEQEARLPTAKRIIELMIPEGTMGEVMGGLIKDIFQPMVEMGPPPSAMTVAEGLGVEASSLDLSEEELIDLAGIFDTSWEERHTRQLEVLPEVLGEMMSAMEPGLREVMTELYAIKFTEDELTDIEQFFSTETGTKYARESFAMASDPRIMSASMEALPAMISAVGDIEARIVAATADFPPLRSYEELTQQERNAITKATGLSDKDIRANLKNAQAGSSSSK